VNNRDAREFGGEEDRAHERADVVQLGALGGAVGGVVAEAFGLRVVFLGGGLLILCLLAFTLRAVTDATIDTALARHAVPSAPQR
jgi:hypothetical protein